jgi:hypothetical protein
MIGALVVHLVGDVGIHADVCRVQHRQHLGIGHAPREGHVPGDAQLLRERLHLLERGAAAHEPEMDVLAS